MTYRERLEYYKFKISAVGSKERIEGPVSDDIIIGITDAINNHSTVAISYQNVSGTKKVPLSEYVIHCYIYGISVFTKNKILRADIISGSGLFEGFVLFRLDRIRNIRVIKKNSFDVPNQEYTGSDALMQEELVKIKFNKK